MSGGDLRPPEPPPTTDPAARPDSPADEVPLTRRRYRAREAARHALRVPPVPRDFRADIEGMRAIAVLGVLLWHAGLTWLPGGFTGVDVFFVVSGFLMSSLLLEEARARGRIDIGRFYARRARRLLPAALTALVGTAVLTLLFLPRARWAEIGGDIVASAAFLVNWRLAGRSVDYLDMDRAPSPLQHYWSLSVEEQFYLVWPLLLLLMLLVARGRAPVFRALSWSSTVVLLAGSLWLSWWWTQQDASAYFVTPTRVFELMIGGLVALAAHAWPRLPAVVAAVVGWVGLAMVVASLLVIDPESLFPGTWALLPTVGAALVLIAGPAAGPWGPVVVLRHAAMQWVGRLSYSLYLWHWPFIAVAAELARVGRGGPDALPVHWGLLAVLVSVVPAWLSFRYIEEPIRRHGRVLTGQLPSAVVTFRTLRLGLNCVLAGVVLGAVLMVFAPSSVTRADAQWRAPTVLDELREPIGAGTLGGAADDPLADDPGAVDHDALGPDGAGTTGPDGALTTGPDGVQTTGPDGALVTVPPGTEARTAAPPDGTGATDEPAPGEAGDPEQPAREGAAASTALGEPLPEVEIPDSVGELAVPLEQVPDDRPVMRPEGCFVGLTESHVGACEAGSAQGRFTIALVGDSHAGMWISALDDIGRDRGWRIVAMTKSSCPPALDLVVRRTGSSGDYVQCTAWQDGLSERLEELGPDVVLMSSALYSTTGDADVAEGLANRVEQVEQIGAVAALIRDVPRAPFDVPACLSEHQDDVPSCAFDRAEGLAMSGTGHDELPGLVDGLPVVDLLDSICPGRTCSPIVGGVVVWRDTNHLSATYIRSLRDAVEEQVSPLVSYSILRDPAGRGLGAGLELAG